MKIHLNITFLGTVQGVFFRKLVSEYAHEFGVKGFVVNRGDGSVYVEAEASLPILEEFILKSKKGSESAHVENAIVEKGDIKNFEEFKIVL